MIRSLRLRRMREPGPAGDRLPMSPRTGRSGEEQRERHEKREMPPARRKGGVNAESPGSVSGTGGFSYLVAGGGFEPPTSGL